MAGNRAEPSGFQPYRGLIDHLAPSNTTISIVGINVDLKSKEHYEKLAHLATHGQIRALNPANSSTDGDTVFVFSTTELKNPFSPQMRFFKQTRKTLHLQVDLLGHLAAQVVQESIYDACRQAESIDYVGAYQNTIPAAGDYN